VIESEIMSGQWQFWVDRGGTFTDIVAKTPNDELITHKLLSSDPSHYDDATIAGINQVLDNHPQHSPDISNIRIGTTVATNALLERKGEPMALITSKGFADSLTIGYQHRDDLFALDIKKPQALYQQVIEIDERVNAQGDVIQALELETVTRQLTELYQQGISAIAIVFMHGYKYSAHEKRVANIALKIGFKQISQSHQVSKLIKFISRGDTCVVDAYLSPVLGRYVQRISDAFSGVNIEFMQSSGGLVAGRYFKGKDAVLSGPAGGVVAMVETSTLAGFTKIIGFDMGGTSTDVSLYDGRYERDWEANVAGVRLRAPMMSIHTVAAGGGSVLGLDGARLMVGPHSAGAYPGPCSYRNDGPLTVTDINVILGKIQPDLFGHHFGEQANLPLDPIAVSDKFERLTRKVNQCNDQHFSSQALAQGYLTIAVEHMANAIKEISVAKGHNLADFVMACFGGAGAQHACLVASVLGINKIIIHPLSGVLSAYGMGLARHSVVKQQTLELALDAVSDDQLRGYVSELADEVRQELIIQGVLSHQITANSKVLLRYEGSDNTIALTLQEIAGMRHAFECQHQHLFGFVNSQAALIIAAIESEAQSQRQALHSVNSELHCIDTPVVSFSTRTVHFDCGALQTRFYYREQLAAGATIIGPAIIVEQATTVVIEPQWQGIIDEQGMLHLERTADQAITHYQTKRQPMLLEIFNNLFMHIAKEMGLALQASAMSVNIKERLDFSCAIFDSHGALVANAPHMPVHLGSMGSCVKSVIAQNKDLRIGDSYLLNSPYHGGTHLPDLTVVTPVFDPANPQQLLFFVASRGHHADVGGISPGSMPANSTHIEQEGVLFANFLLVEQGQFKQQSLVTALQANPNSARNIAQNISDLKAQLAANNRGVNELFKVAAQYSLPVLLAYMGYVQDAAEEGVVSAIKKLNSGQFCYELDQGSHVNVTLSIDNKRGRATVDFSGTSAQQADNFNAPLAVTRAAVLYVFRTLVNKPIALNDGCLRPIDIVVPRGSMLNPQHPAAVVAGNVETSQVVTDALYGALGILAGSQGTMNNFTFGNDAVQYYETICGGSGAGKNFAGCDAIQTHMTNSRLTDPEILENRFAVRLNAFSIRSGSGGKGEFNGGCGVVREIEFLGPMEAAILSNRRKIAPFGLAGGADGLPGETWLVRGDNQPQRLDSCAAVPVDAGDKMIIKTPGGGGFG